MAVGHHHLVVIDIERLVQAENAEKGHSHQQADGQRQCKAQSSANFHYFLQWFLYPVWYAMSMLSEQYPRHEKNASMANFKGGLLFQIDAHRA